jgi:EmrB/QacA subfamily drug resistance transporter
MREVEKIEKMEKITKTRNPWLSLIPVAIGVFMVMLDTSILNIALPSIAEEFNASASDVQWLLNAYLITLVVLLVTFGRLGDMVKRNLLYVTGMAVFIAGSFLCAKSWDILVFVLARIIQAIGGAIMLGNSMALITELFPPGKRGAAMGLNSILIASSFAFGPVIGGWLTTHLSWHWVFYINLPVGLAGIALGLTLLPSMGEKAKVPIDVLGLALLSISLGFLTLGIIQGQDWGWGDDKTIASFMVAFSYLTAFIVRELTYEHPILDLKLFKIRNFTAGVTALFFMSMGLSTSLFLMPFFLQGIKGLTAEQAGLWIMPIPIVNTVIAPLAGRLSDRMNPKITMSIGPVVFSVGLYLLSKIDADVTFWELLPVLLLIGSGMGLIMPPAMNVMMTSAPPHKAGMASGTIQTSNSLARAMGVSLGGILFTGKMNELIPNFGNVIPNPMQIKILEVIAIKGYAAPLVMITEAFMRSFRSVFLNSIPFILTSLFIVLVFLRGKEHLEVIGRSGSLVTSPERIQRSEFPPPNSGGERKTM